MGEFLRKELTLVQDVARVDFYAVLPEVVFIELDRDRMAQLGVPPAAIVQELQAHNLVANAGRVEVGPSTSPSSRRASSPTLRISSAWS